VLNEVLLSRDHFPERQVHELAVVESGGVFLHGWLDRIQTVLQELAESVITNPHFFPGEYSLSEITLDHRPQGFDAVQLGG